MELPWRAWVRCCSLRRSQALPGSLMTINPSALIAFISCKPGSSAAGRGGAQPISWAGICAGCRCRKGWTQPGMRGILKSGVKSGDGLGRAVLRAMKAGGAESRGFSLSILVTLGGVDSV